MKNKTPRYNAFLDTNILIWGVRKDSSPGQEGLIIKAQNLVQHLNDCDARIMTSTICLGEFLTGSDPLRHVALSRKINQGFMLYPYDEACAVKAASLWRKTEKARETLRGSDHVTQSRPKIINDVMIVATALVHGADVLYTNDRGMKILAEGFLKVQLLDDYEMQLNNQESLSFPEHSRRVH